MARYFLELAPRLWPHVVLIAIASLLGFRSRSLTGLAIVSLGVATVGTAFYWLIQNGIAPPRDQTVWGQLLALLIAVLVPVIATALTAYLLGQRQLPQITSESVALLVGLLSLLTVPSIQLLVGCALTGNCP